MSDILTRLNPLTRTDARKQVERLVDEGKTIRENLGGLMSGLDRRGRMAVGLGSLALVAAGSIGLALRKKRREPAAVEKARRLGRAVARMIP